MNSLFLEEYLRFASGLSFDEQSFYNFDGEAKPIEDFSFFINDIPKTGGSIEYFKNTIFVDTNEIKKSLISPKKFDRVFHVTVDPDNFIIDATKTKKDVKNYYIANNLIVDKGNNIYQRSITKNKEIEFNSYYIELEIIA